jgi:hypothetical protein
MSAIRTFNVEAGMPALDEARRLVAAEIKQAKREGAKVLKVIHGYGSSGRGRALCIGLRKSFGLRKKEGVIKDYIAGEDFSIFNDAVLAPLEVRSQSAGPDGMFSADYGHPPHHEKGRAGRPPTTRHLDDGVLRRIAVHVESAPSG